MEDAGTQRAEGECRHVLLGVGNFCLQQAPKCQQYLLVGSAVLHAVCPQAWDKGSARRAAGSTAPIGALHHVHGGSADSIHVEY